MRSVQITTIMGCSSWWNDGDWHMKAAPILALLAVIGTGLGLAIIFMDRDDKNVDPPEVQLGFDPAALYSIAVAEGDQYDQSNWMLSVDSANIAIGNLRDLDAEDNPQSYYAFVSPQLPASFSASFAGWSLQSNGQLGSDELFRIVAFDNGVFDPDGWSLSAKPVESYGRDQRDEESNFCFVQKHIEHRP
jgi:hypothetical protein